MLRAHVRSPYPAPTYDGRPDGRVRCGVVTPALLYGGAERWLLDLIRWTDPARIRWVGVSLSGHLGGARETVAQVQCLCSFGAGPSSIKAMARQVDVLVVWGIPQFARYLPPDAACRVVLVSHGSGSWTERVFSDVPANFELVAVAKDALRPLSPAQRGRCRVIYNGIDPDRVRPSRPRADVRREWGVPPGAQVAGFLARLSAEKNPLGFVAAIAALPAEWHGVMAGVGAAAPQIEAESERLRCADRIHLPGFTPDVGSALAAMDCLLMPAHEEGYGLALVEAMLARVPVISTPVGIVPEVPDLVRLVPLNASGEQLALAVLLDQLDPQAAAARVERAYRWAAAHATAERFGRAWTEYLTG